MKSVKEFIKDRNDKVIAEWVERYQPGMKKVYILNIISKKYNVGIPTLHAIIKKYGY